MRTLLQIHLKTLYVLDAAGRIRSTREPQATPGPAFTLIRSTTGCVWAVRAGISVEISQELDRLAREEPPLSDLRDAPAHADQYQSMVGGRVYWGPAFTFPKTIAPPAGVVPVEDERLLERHFTGWIPGEIGAGRAPVMAVMEHGISVSVCFCARSSEVAAEAGLETAPGFRGLGYGPRVTAAWALAVRASGRIPLYSTDWSNESSLGVARKLGLEFFAVDWNIYDSPQIL